MLKIENVSKRFGGIQAIREVSAYLKEGEVVGLIGPNGAGKTTLFNLISGFLPTTSGEIRYKGKKITGLKPHQICKKGVARTFQSAKLFAGLTVFENALAASLFGTKRTISVPDAEKEAKELLEFVELSTVGAMLAKDLPIANRKRLEVAPALATQPALKMFDEGMAGVNSHEGGSRFG